MGFFVLFCFVKKNLVFLYGEALSNIHMMMKDRLYIYGNSRRWVPEKMSDHMMRRRFIYLNGLSSP